MWLSACYIGCCHGKKKVVCGILWWIKVYWCQLLVTSYPLHLQRPQLLPGLHLWHFPFQDGSSTSLGISSHWVLVKPLISTLSIFLAQITCVGMSTHSRDLAIVRTAMHVQGGHHLVRSTPLQCRQPTVVGAREDLRATLSLCAYRVCWQMLLHGGSYYCLLQLLHVSCCVASGWDCCWFVNMAIFEVYIAHMKRWEKYFVYSCYCVCMF